MEQKILTQLIQDMHTKVFPLFQKRELAIPLDTEKIITLIGPRRSGKTSELLNIIQALFEQGIQKERIFYLNCEDERFDHTKEELNQAIMSYQFLYPDLDLSTCYFFFDEIQLFDKWDRFIRRLYDTVSKHLFLTGSNAKLLSKEIATELRGRSLSYSVLPLSFSEFCSFQKLNTIKRDTKNNIILYKALDQYLYFGGFPELLHYEEGIKIKILQEYFNVMFYRDLVERFNVKNVALLKFFIKRLISCATKEFSINKMYNDLKSGGYKIAKDSLYHFADHCEATYLVLSLKKYSSSIIHQELTEKKIYVIDNGLFNATNPKFSQDNGKLMEQAVFHHLLRESVELFFHKQKYECDFLVKEGFKITRAIQVSYDVSDKDTFQREVRGLHEACKTNDLTEGYIITYDEQKSFIYEGVQIHCIPILDFFLMPLPVS